MKKSGPVVALDFRKKKVVEESDQKLLYFILVSLVIENLIAAMNFNCVWMSSESLPDSVL